MAVGDRFADPALDLGRIDAVAGGALDLLDDDEGFLAALVRHREGRAAVFAQAMVERLHGALDVLRIVVDAADDNEVLDPAGNEQIAGGAEKAEISGRQ